MRRGSAIVIGPSCDVDVSNKCSSQLCVVVGVGVGLFELEMRRGRLKASLLVPVLNLDFRKRDQKQAEQCCGVADSNSRTIENSLLPESGKVSFDVALALLGAPVLVGDYRHDVARDTLLSFCDSSTFFIEPTTTFYIFKNAAKWKDGRAAGARGHS